MLQPGKDGLINGPRGSTSRRRRGPEDTIDLCAKASCARMMFVTFDLALEATNTRIGLRRNGRCRRWTGRCVVHTVHDAEGLR